MRETIPICHYHLERHQRVHHPPRTEIVYSPLIGKFFASKR